MIAILLVFLLLPLGALADPSGPARVIDGDTIDISGQRIRLHGIDTPEAKQICQREALVWLCGAVATKALREMIGGAWVACSQRDKDRYGRVVAVCRANGVNLNAAMVQSGMALAYRKYSDDYTGQEGAAKAARRGLWAGQFIPPWEWRRGKRLASETAANGNSPGCWIKGNIGSKGDRIYHMPGGRWYDRAVITASKGSGGSVLRTRPRPLDGGGPGCPRSRCHGGTPGSHQLCRNLPRRAARSVGRDRRVGTPASVASIPAVSRWDVRAMARPRPLRCHRCRILARA